MMDFVARNPKIQRRQKSRESGSASRLQIEFPEFLRRRAELAKLINGRARRRKGEGLERFGQQLVEVGSVCEARGHMRTEAFGRVFRNKRRNIRTSSCRSITSARGAADGRISVGLSEGAGNIGCTLHPRSRAQNCTKETHTSIQVQRRQSGIPCAMALRLTSYSPR